jgi:hypothetical protein
MAVRLFQSAGKSFRLETRVLELLQLKTVFFESRDLEQSESVGRQWRVHAPDSPLRVLLLSRAKAAHLRTALAHLRLTPPLAALQAQFEAFCRADAAAPVRFQWIFDDNGVVARAVAPGCFDITLRLPLVVAVLLVEVATRGRASVADIVTNVGLTEVQVRAIITRVSGAEFPLLLVSEGTVCFNPDFETRARRVMIIAPGFSLPKLPKGLPGNAEAPRLAYEVEIVTALKRERAMTAG